MTQQHHVHGFRKPPENLALDLRHVHMRKRSKPEKNILT